MKKIFFAVLLLILFVTSVDGLQNRLYFYYDNGNIYYDSEYIEQDYFIKHLDMIPGKKYNDNLIIENGTNKKYTVFMKVVDEYRNALEEELVNNILMSIYLDGELIYEGKALGLDYSNSGVNLQEAVMLGDFDSSDIKELNVVTRLANYYDNTENRSTLNVTWRFYVQDALEEDDDNNEVIEVIDAPSTGNNKNMFIPILALVMMVVGIFIVFYSQLKEESKRLNGEVK